MFFLSSPTPAAAQRFLQRQALLPFSYPDVGATNGSLPRDYLIDHNRILLGYGERLFTQARVAIGNWTTFDLGWVDLPGLCFAALLGVSALWQVRQHLAGGTTARLRLAAFLFLPIGAAWLVAFHLGLEPFGFRDTIVLLTAIHFHYTGFAATLWVACLGEALPRPSRLFSWFAAGFVLATPLIAAGITYSPHLEIGGVLLLASMLLGLAGYLYRAVLPTLTGRLGRVLLATAPLAMGLAIALAVTYGIGEYVQRPLLTIPQMVRWHGWLNAFGFTLVGLLGWRLIERSAAAGAPPRSQCPQ